MTSTLTSAAPIWRPLCLLWLPAAIGGLAFAADEPSAAPGSAAWLRQEAVSRLPDPEIRDCPGFLEKLEPVVEMDLRVQPAPEVPDCARGLFTAADSRADARGFWAPRSFHWAASDTYHQPLYFDDTLLERYGQSVALVQPLVSAGRFFGTLPLVPYQIGLDLPHDRIYTLGQYRPGSPTPSLQARLPLQLDASLVEGATWTALLLVLP